MFDGLRDSLDRFRRDVDDAAEVEDADGDEPENEGELPAEETPAEESEGATVGAETTDEEEGDAPTAGEDDPAAEVPEPAEAAADERADAEEPEAEEGNETPGFAGRVGSLARGRVVIDEDDIEGPLRELELALLSNDVEMGVAEEIIERVRNELVGETRKLTHGTGSVAADALSEALLSVVSVGHFDFEERIAEAEKPVVVVFTGVNGVGKTTTIAKMSRYLEERGYSSVLANGDTYRAGANEQLLEHAEALGRKCITHQQGGDPAAVVYDAVEYAEANDVDVVLGDTAGRLHTNEDLMNQLAKIDRVVDPDLVLFVDEAVAGQDAVRRAEQFNDAASIDGTILTKADADTSGGAAISIAHVTGRPILFLGTGQGYEDLDAFDPEALVERLVEGE